MTAGELWSHRWAWWRPAAPHGVLAGHTDWVTGVATATLAGRPIAVSGGFDRTVRIWDLTAGGPIGEPQVGDDYLVRTVAAGMAGDRPIAVSADSDDTLRVWHLATGAPVGPVLAGHTAAIERVAVVPDGDRCLAVSGDRDGRLRTWDLSGGRAVGELQPGHEGAISALATAVVGGAPVAVSGGEDGRLRVWDLRTGTEIRCLAGHGGERVAAAATTRWDGRTVAVTAGRDGHVRVWDLVTGAQLTAVWPPDGTMINAVAPAVLDGRLVAALAWHYSDEIEVWELTAGAPVGGPLVGHFSSVTAVEFTAVAGRPVLVSASQDGTVRVWWEPMAGGPADPVTGPDSPVVAVAAAELAGRSVLVSGCSNDRHDVAVRLWDAETGAELAPLAQPPRPPVHRSGRFGRPDQVTALTTAVVDGRPAVVVAGKERTDELPTADAPADAEDVAVPADWEVPRLLAVRCWDLESRMPVGEPMVGHTDGIATLAAATVAGRSVAVSGGDDGVVRAWNLVFGTPLGQPLSGPDPGIGGTDGTAAGRADTVTAVAITLVGDRPVVVSGTDGGSVQVAGLAGAPPAARLLAGVDSAVTALVVAAVAGRPVAVAATYQGTLLCWDLLTAVDPPAGRFRWSRPGRPYRRVDQPGQVTALAWHPATGLVLGRRGGVELRPLDPAADTYLDLDAKVNAITYLDPTTLAVGTDRGLAVVDLHGPASAVPAP